MICQNCNKPFKIHVLLEGKLRNLSTRKFCLECSPFKAHHTRHPNHQTLPAEKLCRRCTQTKKRDEFYTRRDGKALSPYCIKCSSNETRDRQRRLKLLAVAYKGGECEICGYDRCVAAMDFHHVDPKEKDFNISKMKSNLTQAIKDELDKCILLCSRCHREVEDGFTELPTSWRSQSDSNARPLASETNALSS